MANGAPPLPETKPPGPEEPTLPEGAGPSGGDERRDEKCRKTQVKRVHDESGKYWVDVEQLTQATFLGAQWAGPETGNQTQETILNLSPQKLKNDESCGDVMSVGMNPSNPIVPGASPSGGEGRGPPTETKVPARKAAYLQSRNNIRRKFQNKTNLECCKDMKRRVQFNNIEEKYLKAEEAPPPKPEGGGGGGGEEGEHPPFPTPPAPDKPEPQMRSLRRTNGGGVMRSLSAAASNGSGGGSGGSAGKVPPKAPKEYKEAVRKSKDSADLYLDICIPKTVKLNKTGKRQEIRPKEIWKNGQVDLPPGLRAEIEAKDREMAAKKAAEEKTKEDAAKGPSGTGDSGGGSQPEKEDTSKGTLTPSPKGPFFKLDPYQVPINFGPDSLAVEFYDGAGPALTEDQITP